jgi:hypothetical protein
MGKLSSHGSHYCIYFLRHFTRHPSAWNEVTTTNETTETTVTMVPSGENPLLLALFILRILSPAIVLLSTLTLFPARPPQPSSPSPITPVVVESRVPRRALILSLLSFISFAYLLDGLAYVVFVVLNKHWTITGIDINAVLGLVAFSGLAALGAWKDVHGVDVWSLKRVKHAVNLSLDVDIAIVVLIALDIKQRREGDSCA